MSTPQRSSLAALLASVLLVAGFTGGARAEIRSETIDYEYQGQPLRGVLFYDDAAEGPRPGVMVVHEWWGLNDYAKGRARQLAEMGYVAFAADMYGPGKVTTDAQQAGQWSGAVYADRDKARGLARAGLDALAARPEADADRLGAIGFCFGGTTVLELAYSGAPVAGVVSFHGSPRPATDADARRIEARLLVLHGAADPMVPLSQIETFVNAVEGHGIDWELVMYGGAVHAFTNPAADHAGIDGVAYDADAAERSWARMQWFFETLFAE